MAILEVSHIEKHFGKTNVLKDVSFSMEEGTALAIIGSSGSGKTTLLRCLNFLERPNSGTITVNGETLFDAASAGVEKDAELRKKRLHFGMVFQSFNLFPQYTALQNVTLAEQLLAQERPDFKADKKKILEEIDAHGRQLLERMGLAERMDHYPHQLSGGQQQRIGILRALAASPPIVLMDEPFSALDPMTRRTLQQEVRTLQQKLNKTFVFVTHDMAEALDLADVIIFMDHGRIVQMAPPEEMLSHPASGQIQDFLGKFIDLQAHKELTAADFMRTGVYTVSTRKGINECISKMQRHNVDTLIVVDDQARYQGTVSIADIRLTGHVVQTIEPLIRCNTPTVHAEDNAKDCFDQLISSGAPYLVVLDGQGQVAGIITKTSMASAMAEQLWG